MAEETPELAAETLRKLRVEYWLKRLDHTLTHTQTSSRLIYLVDAGVLAFIYFSIQMAGATRQVIFLAAFPTLLLVLLNLLHARLVGIQHSWYGGIDAKLMELLQSGAVQHRRKRRVLASTHKVYQAVHLTIAGFLLCAAIAMLLYGIGWFAELQILPPSPRLACPES
jgi:hypothetical protein